MKSFNSVYNDKKVAAVNEQKKVVDMQKSNLLAKIKSEYSIKDFHALTESEKDKFRSMINEMWNKETGLNEAGIRFINEGVKPLTAESDHKAILDRVKREIDAKGGIIKLIQNITLAKPLTVLTDIEAAIRKEMGKSQKKEVKQCVGELIMSYLSKSIKF